MAIQTAKGVRDIPPEEKIIKNQVIDTLKKIFELYGFAPLETPILERLETLSAKFAAGESSDALKETFKLKDQGDRDLGLRFDLTVPLGRFVAMNPVMKMPFKRYEMGPVFRDGPLKLGRYREFWQCDVDIIGTSSMLAEAEILALVQDAFNRLKMDVVLKVNNRKLLNGILEQIGITDKENAIIAIDKLDKIGREGVAAELRQRGYDERQIEQVFEFIRDNITLTQLKANVTAPEAVQGIKELEELFGYLNAMNVRIVKFDVSLARGLAYYTGTVFEAYLPKGPVTSSLAGGGRWDNMIGKFVGGSREVPAVGVAFGLEPIMDTLKAKQEFTQKTPARVFIAPVGTMETCLAFVQQLRERGINASIDLAERNLRKNLDYAAMMGIPYVLIIGDQELSVGRLILRDMASGEQQNLTLVEVIKFLKTTGKAHE